MHVPQTAYAPRRHVAAIAYVTSQIAVVTSRRPALCKSVVSMTRAHVWCSYEAAARKGVAAANYNLAVRYEAGRGVD